MAKRKMGGTSNVRRAAEYEAEKIRNAYALGSRDIGDIFRFIEQALGYLLVRYPFGEKALEGFSSLYQGEPLVVTNSSMILSRERFTAAHELGHHVFDFANSTARVKTDHETGLFNERDPVEYRADCFAAALLMPRSGIEKVVHEMGVMENPLSHTDIIRLQIEFGVSYRAMVRRLSDLGLISNEYREYLYNCYAETGKGLRKLFYRVNAPSTALLDSANTAWVPSRYLRCLEMNYEQGLISYPVLQKVLGVIDIKPEDWGFAPRALSVEEEIDIDALIQELSDED